MSIFLCAPEMVLRLKNNYHLKISNWSLPRLLHHFQRIWICKYFISNNLNCWTEDISFTVHVCAVEASGFHFTYLYSYKLCVISQMVLAGPPFKIRFTMSTEKIFAFSNESEKSCIVSDKHHSTQRSSNIRVEEQKGDHFDFKHAV